MAKTSKKELIMDVALKYFSFYGFDNCSLTDIAKECDITKPAIYYHFEDKATLYKEILLKELTSLSTSLQDNIRDDIPQNKLKIYIEIFGRYLIDNPSFGALFSREIANGANKLSSECIKQLSITLSILSSILKDGLDNGTFKNENPFMIQMMIVSTLSSYHTTTPLRKEVFDLFDKTSKPFEVEFGTVISSLSNIIIKGLEK